MNKTAGDRTSGDVMSGPQPPELQMDDPASVAAYIAVLSEELSRLARGSGLVTLSYILDMARLEARAVVTVKAGGGDGATTP
ncbi:hypothetical protein [Xanthobacter agilis]|jgi:hypothetical protein|uniref:Uncharacterized protein n=1 Tax=Xanthobacter agilis TaxID=47492 RepID=A0ABU0LAA5_XANAG|nr:hypothetical protein [Xanthobacter agilis]MDQ0504058.1 hypothetical protein [Xanthobacter agilis]